MPLNKDDFQYIADTIKKYSGICLSDDKEYLLESRLIPVAAKYGISDLHGFVAYLRKNINDVLMVEVIEAMTTNESFFFRDIKPFEIFKNDIMPAILPKIGNNTLRIWSAACSTGQEPYSIAITMLEHPEYKNVKFEIIATDLDSNVIAKAQEGVYSQFEVQRGVPITVLMKYFAQHNEKWHIKDDIKKYIRFDKVNLINDFSHLGNFDIVFCRNVLIYFDKEIKEKVLSNINSRMNKYGIMLTGAAESLVGIDSKFTSFKGISNVFCLKE